MQSLYSSPGKWTYLANIQDRELDNKAAIQLIKEQTLDNAHREVEFQLDLCGGNIIIPGSAEVSEYSPFK